MFNQNWGLEIGYIDFGQATDDLTLPDACNPRGCSSRQWTSEIKRDGFQLFLIGSLPLNESVDLYGKLGAINWDADYQGYERSELYASGPPLGPAESQRLQPLMTAQTWPPVLASTCARTRRSACAPISPTTISMTRTRLYVLQLMGMYSFE